MSLALWPVFEDGQEHSLGDEGVPVLGAYEVLDAIAVAAGNMPLEAFDEHADVPADVVAQLAEAAQDEPDLSRFPVTGAYCFTMQNNYNGALRPPVIYCADGSARLGVRRETPDELLARELGVLARNGA